MAVPSIALVLRTQKARPTGEAPVWIRASHARRSSFFTGTGVAVRPKDWNDNRAEVRGSHPLAKAYNERLSDLVAAARTAALHAATAADVVAALGGAPRGSLSGALDAHVLRLDQTGKFEDGKKYRSTRAKLRLVFGWPLSWSDLTPDALARFDAHLKTALKNGVNTRRKDAERIRRLARIAIREGSLDPSADPFLRYRIAKAAPVKRRQLSPEEVGQLLALGPDDGVPDGSRLAAVRDCFGLQFYGSGLRISDVLRLTPGDVRGGRFTITMLKTGRPHSVKIPPPAVPILARLVAEVEARDAQARRRYGDYLVPLLKPGDDTDPAGLRRRVASATAAVNKLLKELAGIAKIEPAGLSCHVARHSYADAARKAGDLYAVSKSLGHSTLGMTQTYLSGFDRDAVDHLTDSLWTDE